MRRWTLEEDAVVVGASSSSGEMKRLAAQFGRTEEAVRRRQLDLKQAVAEKKIRGGRRRRPSRFNELFD